jgi:alanine-glyoxylate transaminase/serine-glyoxylate transaminase/serine-pyruvate transaminase
MSQPRMPGRNFLFVPGPTNVPDRVMRAMMVAMEDDRSSKFPQLTLWLFEELKKVFKTTTGQFFIFPSSGTGGWEAALTNTLSPSDKVLAPRFGQFSHLWIDLAQRIGLDVVIQDEEWGNGASPERIEGERIGSKASRPFWSFITRQRPASPATSPRCDARWMRLDTRQCSTSTASARSRASIFEWMSGP